MVDDNPSDRALVERFLKEKNFDLTVNFASSGEEALTLAEQQNFDCAVVDYRLPGMNGIQLTEALHACDVHGEFPVVMLTGFGTEKT
ncbi:MAG: response regulator, partial [Gammaproteobacteria bacterium]|nr:response regulator [Gammaproteobacteria bacterium]